MGGIGAGQLVCNLKYWAKYLETGNRIRWEKEDTGRLASLELDKHS
jgi:hypothetical protein